MALLKTNTGIGTTNPTSALHVFGDGLFTGIVTATTFSGQINSGVGTFTNLTATNATLTNINSSGITTLGVTTLTRLTAQSINSSGIVTGSTFRPSSGYIQSPNGTNSFYIYDGTGNVAFQGTIGASQVNNSQGYKVIGFAGTNNATFENHLYVSGITTSIGGFVGNLVGIASTAILAQTVNTVTASDTPGTYHLTFVNSHNASATAETLFTDDGIYYNPGTNTFTTQHALFTGDVNVSGITSLAGNVYLGNSGSDTITVVGVTTFTTSNVYINNQLYVGAIQITGGAIIGEDITARHLNLSGIATVAQNLDVNGGADIAGGLTVSSGGIYVNGISTFANTITGTISTATKLENSRTFEITGDVVASAISFDGTGNVSLAATIQPNSVGLGTDTFGDYVKDISGTANEIIVTGGTGEGSSPIIGFAPNPTIGGNVTIGNDLQVNNNLNVTGNITVGGTAAYIIVQDFRVTDADIILGFTTDAYGNDVSTDTTANHGGIAIASTEGYPLVQLINVSIGETLPATYKKFMWFEAGSFAGLNTDAWLSNYAIGIGSTQFPSGTRLAAGAVQFSEHDLTVIRNINASGVITAVNFIGTASTASFATTAFTLNGVVEKDLNVAYAANAGVATYAVNAGIATYANNAGIATYAVNAGIATYADSAGISTYATSAGIATYASLAGVATYADSAGVSTSVVGGVASVTQLNVSGISTLGVVTSGNIYSTGIVTALNFVGSLTGAASTASFATTAFTLNGIAEGNLNVAYAANAGVATYAVNAGVATYAVNAGIATYSNSAGVSTSVIGGIASVTELYVSGITTLGIVTVSQLYVSGVTTSTGGFVGNLTGAASTASFATTAYYLTDANNIINGTINVARLTGTYDININGNATTANYATLTGIATYADNAGISTYATLAGIATYATSAGIASYADNAGIATYATLAGISTYATSAGVSTSVIGGIASVTQLNVSGVTTSNSYSIGSTEVISSGRQLQNILSLDAVTTATIESAIQNSPNTFTDLEVTGISTLGVTSTTNLTTQQLNVSGLSTFSGITTHTEIIFGTKASFTGVVTASSFSGNATSATYATLAGVATYADSAGIATYASIAGIATYATLAGISTYASLAGIATYADNAGISTNLKGGVAGNVPYQSATDTTTFVSNGTPGQVLLFNGSVPIWGNVSAASGAFAGITIQDEGTPVGTANSITTLNFVSPNLSVTATSGANGISTITLLDYVSNAGVATYASVAGIATYASVAGIATYATNAGVATYADNAGIATYATNAGVATYATNAGVATYASVAGIATYADVAGISTSVIGGIGSITQLNVSGVSTLGSVEISSGIITATSGIVTYYGDGSKLQGIVSVAGISVQDEGNTVGTSVTTLNFSGSSVSISNASGGISTVTIIESGIATYADNAGITTNLKGGVAGNVPYQSATDTTAFVTNGLSGQVLLFNGSIPIWGNVSAASGAFGGISVQDEGTPVGTANSITTLDFRGNNIVVTATSGANGISTITLSDYVSNAGVATYASNAGVATALQNSRTFEITGDIIASPISFNGTGNVSLAATIQPNSVGLGTDTTGDYVRDITGTANQITVTGGTGEGSTPTLSIPNQFTVPQDLTVTRDVQINRNLNVTGNITIGGTSATLFTTELKVSDPDLILGFRTDAFGNDISNDTTANHGGISVASTEGTPLVSLYNPGIGESTLPTYKKIMWFKTGSFAGLGTDAWLINYAVGIGSTQFPTGTRLAAGNVQFNENDLAVVRNINASGIVTATDFNSASDAKLKTNIEPIANPLEKVIQIQGVSFNWIKDNKPSMGVIADELQKVLPELVSDTDPKTVNYNGLIGLLIESVKQQQIKIQSLEERISRLE